MSTPGAPGEAAGAESAPAVGRRVEAIVAAAERSAGDYQRQIEQDAALRAARLLEAAEADSRRLRDETTQELATYRDDARRRVEAFAAERMSQISQLSDTLVARADDLGERFESAETARRQIHELIAALGDAAARVAEIRDGDGPELPPQPVLPTAPQVPGVPSGGLGGPAAPSAPAPAGAPAPSAPSPVAGATAAGVPASVSAAGVVSEAHEAAAADASEAIDAAEEADDEAASDLPPELQSVTRLPGHTPRPDEDPEAAAEPPEPA